MGRRTRAALALAAVFATVVRATEGARAEDCSYYTKSELDAWTALLEKDHLPGTGGQKDLLDYLEVELGKIPSVTVELQPTKFTRWEPGKPRIDECDGVVWPLPYSGFTTADGVNAPLVYGRSVPLRSFHFNRKEHGGKIVVVERKPLRMREILSLISTRRIGKSGLCGLGAYRRSISLELQVPSLEEARNAGVRGLIVVVDENACIAAHQFVPFTRDWQDIPAVYMDRSHGDKLIEMAKKHMNVTLHQPGTRVPDAESRHVLVTLPATKDDKIDDQNIVIDTHTDGPNFFEENGVVALWALLKKLATDGKPRQRDLVFVFAAAHFSHEAGSNDEIIRHNPRLFEQTRAALVIEHLGALQWSADLQKPKKPEPALILTSQHAKDLGELAKCVAKNYGESHTSMPPAFFINPLLFKFGEGKFLAERDVPTIGYLTNPAYLLAKGDWHKPPVEGDCQRGWFSRPLMCEQLGMFEELIREMMKLDS
jgi:hypothetical protein